MRHTYKYDRTTGLMLPADPAPPLTCNMLAVNQLVGFGAGRSGYKANAVVFDGSNDYLARGADLDGNADGKEFTFSIWLKRNSTGSFQRLYEVENVKIILAFNNDDTIIFFAKNSSGTTILDIRTTAFTDTSSWHHLAGSIDLTTTSNRHILLDGTDIINTINEYTDDTIDFTDSEHAICGATDGSKLLDADVADLFFRRTYTDLSADNLFRDADGKPTNPGAGGSGYGLGVPIIMLKGPTPDWHMNDGSGGGFTENGALTTASTSPSD